MRDRHDSDRVVVLDRDGTIVVDKGYLRDPKQLEFAPHAPEGLRWLYSHGYRLVVVTNQSGVGRGLFSLADVEAANARLTSMVEEMGARIDRIYFCPHVPGDACQCRKPAQRLFEKAVEELQFDPKKSVVIGDKDSDTEFGRRAGAFTILISPDADRSSRIIQPDVIAPNLMAAAHEIVERG
jgi:D-glycero-D-manno-heptose 1,7-bisphosphate phosphatase